VGPAMPEPVPARARRARGPTVRSDLAPGTPHVRGIDRWGAHSPDRIGLGNLVQGTSPHTMTPMTGALRAMQRTRDKIGWYG
jgi:hypothetical protein